MKIMIQNVRLAFPQLWEPQQVNGEGKPAHSASLLTPAADPDVFLTVDGKQVKKKLSACMKEVAKAKWGAKADAIYTQLQKTDKLAIHDGDAKAEYAGFPGNHFISARNETRPTVLDRDKSPLTASDGRPYAGCYVHASLELWAQDNKFGKRINASLRGIQFYKDGEAFSGGGAADADEFEDIADGADAEDLSDLT